MYRLILAGMVLVGMGLGSPAASHAAEKPRKEKPAAKAPAKAPAKAERPAPRRYKGDATNDSIFAQQQTADSFAARNGTPTAPTTQKTTTSPESQNLASLDGQIAAENERHIAASESLLAALAEADKAGDRKASSKARKAVAAETSAHQRKNAALEKQRQDLLRKAAPAAESNPPRGTRTTSRK